MFNFFVILLYCAENCVCVCMKFVYVKKEVVEFSSIKNKKKSQVIIQNLYLL